MSFSRIIGAACAVALSGCVTINASKQDAKPVQASSADQLTLAKIMSADDGYFSAKSSIGGSTDAWSNQCQGFGEPLTNENHGFVLSAAIDHPATRRWSGGSVQYIPILVLQYQKGQNRVCQTEITNIARLVPLSVWNNGDVLLHLKYVEVKSGGVDLSTIASLAKKVIAAIDPALGIIMTGANAVVDSTKTEMDALIARSVDTKTEVSFTPLSINREKMQQGTVGVEFPIKADSQIFLIAKVELDLQRSFFVNASTNRGGPNYDPDMTNFDKDRILVNTKLGIIGNGNGQPKDLFSHFNTQLQDGREPFRQAKSATALNDACRVLNAKLSDFEITPRDKSFIKWAHLKENDEFGKYDDMTVIDTCLTDRERAFVRGAGLSLQDNLPTRSGGVDLPLDCRTSLVRCAETFSRRLFGPTPKGLAELFASQVGLSNASDLVLDGFTGTVSGADASQKLASIPSSRQGCIDPAGHSNAYISFGLIQQNNKPTPVRVVAYYSGERRVQRIEIDRPDANAINAACTAQHQNDLKAALLAALTGN